MARAVRSRFFLAFHERPPAANVYREDAVYCANGGPTNFPHVGQRITVKPGRSPETFTVLVLAIGKKTDLQKFKVDTIGRVYRPDEEIEVPPDTQYVGTWYQEKQKQKASSGGVLRERYLHEVAEGLAGVGHPGPEDFARKKVCRRPKVHTSAEREQLKEECSKLSCWTQTDGDVEIIKGTKVYVNGAVLNHLKGDFKMDPIRLFKEILKLCAGDFASKRGVCATEGGAKHRGKVQFPPAVVHAAFGYCTVNCTVPVKFEPTYILRTFLDKKQNPKKKSSATQGPGPQSSQDHEEQEEHTENDFTGPIAPSATRVVGVGRLQSEATRDLLLNL